MMLLQSNHIPNVVILRHCRVIRLTISNTSREYREERQTIEILNITAYHAERTAIFYKEMSNYEKIHCS